MIRKYLPAEGGFSNPVTAAEVQRIVDSVNAFSDVARAVDSVDTSSITVADLQTIDGLEGLLPPLEALYQQGPGLLPPNSLERVGQLQFVVNVVNGGDADSDGLSNRAEVLGFRLTVGQDTRLVFPDPHSADTDNDGLQDGTRPGGDRFLGGAAGWNDFDSLEVATSPMPAWWKPVLPHLEERVLNSTQGAGSYLDGFSADGAAYLEGSTYGSDYAAVRRGGQWGNSGARSRSGIATTSVENGPDDRRVGIGFRAVRR